MSSFGANRENEEVPTTSTTSSKAVLSALRALQDKIRRLETEKAQALEETAHLRQSFTSLQADADQLRARDDAIAQRNIMEAKGNYDRLLAEKTDLEVRVKRAEERKSDIQRTHDELKEKIRTTLDEKHASLNKVKEVESHITHLETQLGHLHKKESELGETLTWEVKKHENDMDGLNSRLTTLQEELLTVVKEKSVHDTKMAELDQLVGQLLTINESLVAKLTGTDERGSGKKKGNKGGAKNGGKNGSTKANALKPTSLAIAAKSAKDESASIKAAAAMLKIRDGPLPGSSSSSKKSPPRYAAPVPRAAASPSNPVKRGARGDVRDVRDMKGVNKMYQDLLKELIVDKKTSLNAQSAGLISAASAANEAVRAASAAAVARSSSTADMPELGISAISASSPEYKQQQGDEDDEDDGDDDDDEDGEGDEDDKDDEEGDAFGEEGEEEKETEGGEGAGGGAPPVASIPTQSAPAPGLPFTLPTNLKGFGNMMMPTPNNTSDGSISGAEEDDGIEPGVMSSESADYQATLAGLELEFQMLDERYHQILKGIDGSGNAVDTADSAEALVEVIRQLHAKGAQLREMRAAPK